MTWKSFRPTPKTTVNIAVGAASAAVKLTDDPADLSVRVYNDGSATVWIAFDGPSATATLTQDIPIPSKGVEVFTAQAGAGAPLYVAAIAAGATGNVYFTLGMGL